MSDNLGKYDEKLPNVYSSVSGKVDFKINRKILFQFVLVCRGRELLVNKAKCH